MSSKQSRGLGKGLSALLGDASDVLRKPVTYVNKEVGQVGNPSSPAEITNIPIDLIEPNPFQPRGSFDPDALAELTSSIKVLGLIQPITVRAFDNGKYQIISGERRFRACRAAGLNSIAAYVRKADDKAMLEMAIVENVQREDLDPIEVALSYKRLIEECGLTQEQMAERVGKKRASVTNYLRLLRLPAKVQHDVKLGLISVGHAKALLGAEDPVIQESLCDEIIRKDLSVRALEERVRQLLAEDDVRKTAKREASLPEDYCKVLDVFGKYFASDISLKRFPSGKGTMTIRISSDEELNAFLKALENSNI